MILLRPARQDEAALLTALCLRSKAVWGYDQAFMDACRAELTLSAETIRTCLVQVAELRGQPVGMAQISVDRTKAGLDKLFIEPNFLRLGIGQALFTWAEEAAARAGAKTPNIDADPGAAAFYRRLGAVDEGTVPSGSIPGRVIPRLIMKI